MRSRTRRHFAASLAMLLLAAAAATPSRAQDLDFRGVGPRAGGNIFSPLELPPPSSLRTAAGVPGPDYWQQRADYRIEATLDPATRLVSGSERIRYVNHSPDSLDYLWLNLEQNAFREDSIAARVGGRTAIGMRDAEGDGFTIRRLATHGKELPYRVYDTLARVELPRPLEPRGGVIELDIAWEFTVPARVFRRFGVERVAQGTVIEIAQWFPSLAVYDDVHGWNTLPYIGTGEFYSDFGDYEVALTVPREWLVVATGELANPKEAFTAKQAARLKKARGSKETVVIVGAEEVGDPNSRPDGKGPLTWRFQAHDVRTFAWAASDAFILDAAGLDGVLIQSAYPKEGLPIWSESTQMLRAAIEGYNRRWFRYPYPVATNVNGVEGGMEYPMIIFCSERHSEDGLFGVTTHEIGHNWFPMVVNTDERRHAWLDEGFNTFINFYSEEEWFETPGRARTEPGQFAASMRLPEQMPIETPADQLPGGLLGMLEYAKTGVGLALLRESILGPERFDYAFRRYVEKWAFRSPRPADFFRCMEDAAGADLAWFWRGWFLETGVLDQEVSGVDQPTDKQAAVITFANLGELVMPLRYRVGFADGTHEDFELPVEVWFNRNRILERVPGLKRIDAVEVDPEELFPDVDRGNNDWFAAEELAEVAAENAGEEGKG